MKELLEVYKDIDKSKININSFRFTNDRKAVIIKNKNNNKHSIYIDNSKMESLIDKKCILAEEYAHYKTGTLYACNSKLETIARLENKARKYQTKYLVPKDELIKAIYEGYYYYYELAEKFDVTEDIIKNALKIYNIEYEIQLINAI